MSIQHIITLPEFCLKNTYFLFLGKNFEQVHGAVMGSAISPLTANLFMDEFEYKAISSAPHPPRLWLKYVDDTFAVQQVEHSHQFLQCNTSIDPHIQFTKEKPFLDTLVSLRPKNTLLTSTYRKPTSTSIGTAMTTYQPNMVSLVH